MFESILETKWNTFGTNRTGTITTAVASTALVGVGTTFTTTLTAGDVISYVDDAGVLRNMTILSVTDNTNAVLATGAPSVAGGVVFQIVTRRTPSFIVDDPNSEGLPRNRIYKTATNAEMTSDDQGTEHFSFNNGILIKSMYLRLPYQFTLGDNRVVVEFESLTLNGNVTQALTELGSFGEIHVPIENIEVPLNSYIPVPDDAVDNSDVWSIRANVKNVVGSDINAAVSDHGEGDAVVSNINVPSILTGQLLPIIIGLRVVHAYPMVPIV